MLYPQLRRPTRSGLSGVTRQLQGASCKVLPDALS